MEKELTTWFSFDELCKMQTMLNLKQGKEVLDFFVNRMSRKQN